MYSSVYDSGHNFMSQTNSGFPIHIANRYWYDRALKRKNKKSVFVDILYIGQHTGNDHLRPTLHAFGLDSHH